MLTAYGLCRRGAEFATAHLALIAGDRLVVVLRHPVALLAIETPRWIGVVLTRWIGANRTGVFHGVASGPSLRGR